MVAGSVLRDTTWSAVRATCWRSALTAAATAHWDRVQVQWEWLLANLLRLAKTRRVWSAVGQYLRLIKDRGRDGDFGAGSNGAAGRTAGDARDETAV